VDAISPELKKHLGNKSRRNMTVSWKLFNKIKETATRRSSGGWGDLTFHLYQGMCVAPHLEPAHVHRIRRMQRARSQLT
jgi:hypothetical protein